MKNKQLMLLLLCGISASATLHAEMTYIFEEIDSDHNGAISRSEAEKRPDLINNFDVIDSDGNNALSVDEYSSYMNKGVPPEDMEIPEPGAAPVM